MGPYVAANSAIPTGATFFNEKPHGDITTSAVGFRKSKYSKVTFLLTLSQGFYVKMVPTPIHLLVPGTDKPSKNDSVPSSLVGPAVFDGKDKEFYFVDGTYYHYETWLSLKAALAEGMPYDWAVKMHPEDDLINRFK